VSPTKKGETNSAKAATNEKEPKTGGRNQNGKGTWKFPQSKQKKRPTSKPPKNLRKTTARGGKGKPPRN